jgi:putative flippase GtrA
MDYVFFTDADLQFDIVELQNLLVHLPHYSVVIGYRAPRRDPLPRLINARGWNLLNRLLFGLKIRDIDCAFKIFKRTLVQDIHLESQGAMVSAELLVRLKREGVAIKEVPVSHLPRRAGAATGAKLSVILRAVREMVMLYGGDLGSITHKQVLRFATVGVFNTLLDAAAYIALTRTTVVFGEHLVAAKFFSFLAGTISSLLLNRYWTFGVRGALTSGEVTRFYATVSLSLVINVTAMQMFLTVGVHDLMALILSTGLSFLTNFILSRKWVFKKPAKIIAGASMVLLFIVAAPVHAQVSPTGNVYTYAYVPPLDKEATRSLLLLAAALGGLGFSLLMRRPIIDTEMAEQFFSSRSLKESRFAERR